MQSSESDVDQKLHDAGGPSEQTVHRGATAPGQPVSRVSSRAASAQSRSESTIRRPCSRDRLADDREHSEPGG